MNTENLEKLTDLVRVTYKAFGRVDDHPDDAHGYAADLHEIDGWDERFFVDCDEEDEDYGSLLPGWTEVHADGRAYAVRDEDIYAEVQWIDGHRGWYTSYPLGGQTSCGDPEAITDGGILLISQAW